MHETARSDSAPLAPVAAESERTPLAYADPLTLRRSRARFDPFLSLICAASAIPLGVSVSSTLGWTRSIHWVNCVYLGLGVGIVVAGMGVFFGLRFSRVIDDRLSAHIAALLGVFLGILQVLAGLFLGVLSLVVL